MIETQGRAESADGNEQRQLPPGFRDAHSREDLIGQREAIAGRRRTSYGRTAHARLQGVADEHARRETRFLR